MDAAVEDQVAFSIVRVRFKFKRCCSNEFVFGAVSGSEGGKARGVEAEVGRDDLSC